MKRENQVTESKEFAVLVSVMISSALVSSKGGMDEDQIEGCVSGYLKEKGFTQNAEELQHSSNNNNDSSLQHDTLNRTQ